MHRHPSSDEIDLSSHVHPNAAIASIATDFIFGETPNAVSALRDQVFTGAAAKDTVGDLWQGTLVNHPDNEFQWHKMVYLVENFTYSAVLRYFRKGPGDLLSINGLSAIPAVMFGWWPGLTPSPIVDTWSVNRIRFQSKRILFSPVRLPYDRTDIIEWLEPEHSHSEAPSLAEERPCPLGD